MSTVVADLATTMVISVVANLEKLAEAEHKNSVLDTTLKDVGNNLENVKI
ncbi:MAG: hypothetical protein JXA96_07220 [Sedimentisphaerales bacterium]|nr:hypothetical protein [Sedimentisphaerales bacterium]